MNNNFGNLYWQTLTRINEGNLNADLTNILNSNLELTDNQVQYVLSIPEVQQLFRFEEAFHENPELVNNFVKAFPYQRLNSTQGSDMLSQEILNSFLRTFSQKNDHQPSTNTNTNSVATKSEVLNSTTDKINTGVGYSLRNTTETETVESESQTNLKSEIKVERILDLPIDGSEIEFSRQIEDLDTPESAVEFERLNTSDTQQLPVSPITPQSQTLQGQKQRREAEVSRRQEQLRSQGVPVNDSARQLNATSSVNSGPSSLQKGVYAGIAASAGFGGGIIGYLTIFTV